MTFTITHVSRQLPNSRSEFQDGTLQSLPWLPAFSASLISGPRNGAAFFVRVISVTNSSGEWFWAWYLVLI